MDTMKLILKGGVFGIANIIPGVSGGTMAVVLGIYETMIEAIGNIFTNKAKRIEYILFLAKVLLGAGITIVIFSWVMDYLLTYYPSYTYFFFIGLIAGSIPAIYKTHPHMELNWQSVVTFAFGAAILMYFALAFPEVSKSEGAGVELVVNAHQAVKLIGAGILAGGSMIVPGISGSFMLVLIGQYHIVIKAVKEFHILFLAVFGIGVAFGIWSFAKIIDIFLKRFPKETFYFILGLVIASLYPIFPGLPPSAGKILLSLFIMFFAGMLSYRLGEKK